MIRYSQLSLTVKTLITLICITISTVFFYFFKTDTLIVQLGAIFLLFVSLYALFNLANFKIYTKIFIGLALGFIAGSLIGTSIIAFYPVGQVFIRLIKMIVIPLVLASVFVGTASIGDLKKLGRLGLRTLIFYLLSTAIAITIGLLIANTLLEHVTDSRAIDQQLGETYRQQTAAEVQNLHDKSNPIDILTNIIPENPLQALAEGRMLQIIFFALMSGIVITYIAEEKKNSIVRFAAGVTDLSIQLVHIVMKLAPYGVFALISYVIAQNGSHIILTLIGYFVTTIVALLIHVTVFNSLVIVLFTGIKLADFWRGIYPAVLVAFSTSSSSATLPVTMECAEENLNVKSELAGFILPLGSTINMDGTAIFQGVSAVFIAYIFKIDLSIADQLTIILTATLASIGTAGAPQVGIIMLTLVLQSINIPLEGIALILGVERFLDMARTTVNISSDLSCAAVMNSIEGKEKPR